MNTITLYGAMASRAHRVVWMHKELALPFRHAGAFPGRQHAPAGVPGPEPRRPRAGAGRRGLVLFESLVGGRFTAADLNVATVLDLAPQCGLPLDGRPHVQEWHRRCPARPAAADWRDVSFTIPRPPTPLGVLKMFV